MQVELQQKLKGTAAGTEAERILRACVHCGFCTATCPTYRLLGDELDGPRGRIYLIKSMLEGRPATVKTRQHLDRCLTCRACETTCPSGVEYGKLLDIGRHHAETETGSRPFTEKLFRKAILQSLPYRKRFNLLLQLGRLVRPILPAPLKRMIPPRSQAVLPQIESTNQRRVILMSGCVQPALAPEINRAVRILLDRLGISAIELDGEQCCGALSHHLSAEQQSRAFMQQNIDRLWPTVEAGAEAIISTASGCGVHLKDYAYYFREDERYFSRAQKISAITRDISEFLAGLDLAALQIRRPEERIAFQSPCTLQHGQKLNGVVEQLLSKMNIEPLPVDEPYLCCGSAGVYSLLQKEISTQLRKDKLDKLMAPRPDVILTANIGCLEHLRQGSAVPVKHWAVYLAELLTE